MKKQICPVCDKPLQYIKSFALKNGNVMPAYWGHLYSFEYVLVSKNICVYSILVGKDGNE